MAEPLAGERARRLRSRGLNGVAYTGQEGNGRGSHRGAISDTSRPEE